MSFQLVEWQTVTHTLTYIVTNVSVLYFFSRQSLPDNHNDEYGLYLNVMELFFGGKNVPFSLLGISMDFDLFCRTVFLGCFNG